MIFAQTQMSDWERIAGNFGLPVVLLLLVCFGVVYAIRAVWTEFKPPMLDAIKGHVKLITTSTETMEVVKGHLEDTARCRTAHRHLGNAFLAGSSDDKRKDVAPHIEALHRELDK